MEKERKGREMRLEGGLIPFFFTLSCFSLSFYHIHISISMYVYVFMIVSLAFRGREKKSHLKTRNEQVLNQEKKKT